MAINLWPNADFESGVSDWTPEGSGAVAQSTTQAWEQSNSMRWTPDAVTTRGVQSDQVGGFESATQYTVSFYIYPITDALPLKIVAYDNIANRGASAQKTPAAGSLLRNFIILPVP